MKEYKEKKLWIKVQKGDEKSFAKLYDLYIDKIYRFVFLKINNQTKAEEIVQDVFLKLWKISQDENREVRNLSALLYQISRFAVIDYYRSQNIKKETVSIDEISLAEEPVSNDDIEKNIDIEYDIEKIKQALVDLPEIYKDIIIMKFIDELTNKEISLVLNKEEGNVRVLVSRALKKIRQILNKKI